MINDLIGSKRLEEMQKNLKLTPPKNCTVCNDLGWLTKNIDGSDFLYKCDCLIKKEAEKSLKFSGIDISAFNRQTLESFSVTSQFQADMKQKSKRFCNQTEYPFFFIGGQVGAGKTHICVAICHMFHDGGKRFKYVVAPQMLADLKNAVNDDEEYNRILSSLVNANVLYIDDLFKGKSQDTSAITSADVRHLFTAINYRYLNNKITIISSELTMSELLAVDEAVASRISQRCGGDDNFCLSIRRDKTRNYRMRGSQ